MMRIAGKIAVAKGWHAAVLLAALLASLLLGHDAHAAASAARTTAAETWGCRLNVEGGAIERLTLVDASQRVSQFERPAKSVQLPAGKYWVQQVELKGGFSSRGYHGSDDGMEVAAGQSPVLKAGAPLTPRVRVNRTGRLLTLDYELVDAAGRNYVCSRPDRLAKPPTFTVLKHGQTIGSGSFEFG